MSKIDRLTNLTENEEILWQDRKRYLGLPLSFTIYSFSNNKFYIIVCLSLNAIQRFFNCFRRIIAYNNNRNQWFIHTHTN